MIADTFFLKAPDTDRMDGPKCPEGEPPDPRDRDASFAYMHRLRMRRGRFRVPWLFSVHMGYPTAFFSMFDKTIVLDMRRIALTTESGREYTEYEYGAWHPEFDMIPDDVDAPLYKMEWRKDEFGESIFLRGRWVRQSE